MSSPWWSDEVADLAKAAASVELTAADLDQLVEELAMVLEVSLPKTCLVQRMAAGRGPVRRVQLLAGSKSFVCERRPDGAWETSIAVLHGNVTGQPRRVSAAYW
ncbi:MAG: hypothetical protein ACREOV_14020, partial [Candidatus Dormibacteraceae bacterium]